MADASVRKNAVNASCQLKDDKDEDGHEEVIRSTNVKSVDGQWHSMSLLRTGKQKTLLRFELTKKPLMGAPTVHRRDLDVRELLAVRVATNSSAVAPVKLSDGVPRFSAKGLKATASTFDTDQLTQPAANLKPTPICDATTLYLYFIARPGRDLWRLQSIIITFENNTDCAAWETFLHQEMEMFDRPRALLVYINPFGGRKMAQQIYREKVAPIFALAGIRTQVVLTERANHAMDELRTMSPDRLYEFSGVISVGGDGLFNEVLCGAVIREQADSGKDITDIDIPALATPRLKLGIIPAGSTNSVVSSVQGNADPVTAALHIAIGDDCGVDVCTVHQGKDLLRISANAVSYGWMGDVLRDSEHFRHLGPARYHWSGVRTILKHATYHGRVAFRLSGCVVGACSLRLNVEQRGKLQLPPCEEGCDICSATTGPTKPPDMHLYTGVAPVYPFHWQTEWSHIICCVIPCVSPFSPKGLAPFAALGDGSMDLALIPKCSRSENVRFIHKVARSGGKDLRNDPRVKVYRVSRFSFTPTTQPSSAGGKTNKDQGVWNVDGEIIQQPGDTLHFRLHARLIRYFGREIESKAAQTDIKRCFCSRRKAYSAIISGY